MASFIKEALAWVFNSFNPTSPFNTQAIWNGLNMKFGFNTVVTLALGASVQASCPDYTTYSQVSEQVSRLVYS